MTPPAPRLRLCPECGRPNNPERMHLDGGPREQCRCTMEDIVGNPEEWIADMEQEEEGAR